MRTSKKKILALAFHTKFEIFNRQKIENREHISEANKQRHLTHLTQYEIIGNLI